MALTQRVRLLISLLVVAPMLATLAFVAAQADRLSRATLERGLGEARGVWETLQADRYNKLKLGVRVLGNDPAFKSSIATDHATVLDMLKERGQDLGADFLIATDPAGLVVARTDRPTANGDDLSKDPVVMKPLEGEESSSVWRQGDRLYQVVSVPNRFGDHLVGVLIAGYGIDESLANQVGHLTHSRVAFLVSGADRVPHLLASSLGAEAATLESALGRPHAASADTRETFVGELGGERHVGVRVPLRSAGGETVGFLVVLRSVAEQAAPFARFRNHVVLVSLALAALTLGVAYLVAFRIAGSSR